METFVLLAHDSFVVWEIFTNISNNVTRFGVISDDFQTSSFTLSGNPNFGEKLPTGIQILNNALHLGINIYERHDTWVYEYSFCYAHGNRDSY